MAAEGCEQLAEVQRHPHTPEEMGSGLACLCSAPCGTTASVSIRCQICKHMEVPKTLLKWDLGKGNSLKTRGLFHKDSVYTDKPACSATPAALWKPLQNC